MKKGFVLLLLFFTASLVIRQTLCVDIGSDNFPTRFNVQQNVRNGDRVAGFASLDGGLKLDGISVFGTFDSFFSVSNSVDLRCGTLILDRDFIFGDVAEFTSLGNIVGRHHTMEFSATVTLIPYDPNIGCCEASCVTNNLIDFTEECYDVKSVDWSYDDKYIAIGLGGNSYPMCLEVYSFDGSFLLFKDYDDPCTKIIYSVRWHPTKHLIAIGVKSTKYDSEIIIYEFDVDAGTLSRKSSVNTGNSTFAVSWHPSGNYLAIGRYKYNKEIELYAVDSNGIINSTPVEIIDLSGKRYVSEEALDWNSTGEYLVAGVKHLDDSPELLVYKFDDTSETLTLNASYAFGDTVNAVDWNPTYTGFIAVGFNGGKERLFVFEHDETSGTLIQRTAFGNDEGPSPAVYSVDWSPNGLCLSVGWEESSSSEKIEEFQTFKYDFSNYSLTAASSVNLAKEVESVRWSHGGEYVAIGSDINQMQVYSAGCSCGISGCVTFSNLHLFLNNDLIFRNCCITFDGESEINGRGNCLTFCPTCTIQINKNSSLKLKDLRLKCVQDEKFYCLDNSSTVLFDDVVWCLDSNYSFTVGKIEILKDFHIIGEGSTFSYRSSETSVIREHGKLILDNNVTFSYDPISSSNKLIELFSETSEIQLRGATLHATSSGLQLTKGVLSFDRASTLSSEGESESEALVFGDGVTALNNLHIKKLPAGSTDVVQGMVVLKNV